MVATPASAQLFWDGTDTTANADGGNGTWNAVNTNWDDAAVAGANSAWVAGQTANFGGAAGTVSVVGTQVVGGVAFTTSGYTLSNGGAGLLSSAAGLTVTANVATTTLNVDMLSVGAFAINSTGLVNLGGTISAGTTFATDAAGVTALNSAAVNAGTTATFNDAVTVAGSSTVTSTGNAAVTFATTVDGPGNLTVNTTNTTTFTGLVGGITALGSLTTNAGGTTAINGGGVTTTGTQNYGDAVTIGAATTLTGAGITFSTTLNGGNTLVITDSATTTFTGAVGGTTALTSLTTTAGGTTAINGGSVITDESQTYNDSVTLGAATALTSVNNNTISLNGTVDGAQTLAINTTSTTTFGGVVGGTVALTSITTNAGGTTAINASAITTTGAQTYNDAVTFGVGATTLTGNTITFGTTANGASAVVVTDAGTTTFTGAVGGTTALTSLTTTAGGTTAINGGSVITTGLQDYNDAVTLGAATTLTSTGNAAINLDGTVNGGQTLLVNTTGTTTFSGVVGGTTALTSLTTNAGGTTAINTTGITTTGAQTYNDAVTFGAAAVLTGNTITFASTADGAQNVTVTDAGTTTFSGAVGGTTALTSLTTSAGGTTAVNGGGVTTTAGQTYNDAVTVGADAVFTGNTINFNVSLNGGQNVTITDAGTTTFAGAVVGGTTALTSLTTTAGGTTAINGGGVTTTGLQDFNDAVTLGAATILSSTGNASINLDGTVTGAQNLTVNTTGVTTFGGAVNVATVTTNAGGSTSVLASVTTTGAQTYNDAVNVGGTGGTFSGVNLGFLSTLDGGQAVVINDTGATTFAGAVGGVVPLASLTTNAGGTTAINGGAVTTTGAQTYNDAVSLGINTTLTGSTVNETAGIAFGLQNLTVASGGGTFSGNLTGLGSLTYNGTGTGLGAPQLILSGTNTYSGGTFINSGVLAVNNGGAGGAILDTSGVFIGGNGVLAVLQSETVNTVITTGNITMQNGATGQSLTTATFNNGVPGANTVHFDTNFGPGAGGGTSDTLVVTGAGQADFNGTTFNFANSGVGVVLYNEILVADVNGSVGTPTATNLPSSGLIQYALLQNGAGDWVLRGSSVAAAATIGNISVVQSTLGAIVNRPSSPFVASLLAEHDPGYCGPGIWSREVGGTARASSTTSVTGNPDSIAQVGLGYVGAQFGADIACFNVKEMGIDIAVGAIAGYNQGSGSQVVANAGTTNSTFVQGYGGAYATFAKGQFNADIQARVDATAFVFTNPNLQLNNTTLNTLRTTVSGSASYAMPIMEDMLIVPTAGFSASQTTSGTLTFVTGQTLTPNPSLSLVGFAGATIAKTFVQPDQISAIVPFATVTLYNDFAANPTAVFFDPTSNTSQTVTSTHLGAFTEVSFGTNYFRLFEPAADGSGPKQLNATVRIDTRFSNVLMGAGLTAQLRSQF